MAAQAPGDLIASRIAVLPDGAVAEVVITERTGPYAVTLREAYARWYSGGTWSSWLLVTEAVYDVSIAADTSQEEPAAIVSTIVWVPLPAGAIAANHTAHRSLYFRLTGSDVIRCL